MQGPRQGFRGHVLVALIGTLVAAATFFGFTIVGGGLNPGDAYTLKAVVPTSAQLTPSSRVTMSGVDVGVVTAVKRQGLGTLVEMRIEDDAVTPVPADSRVAIRQRTPVGESYIAISPGRSRQGLPEDAVLPASRAAEYVDVDEILSVLQGDTREHARELIQGVGSAVDGRGEELNGLLGGGARTLRAGGRVFKLLSGDRDEVAQLVDRVGRVSAAIGERSATIETLAEQGLTTMRALASRDAAVRDTLEGLPGTLRQVRRTSGNLASASATATPVLAELSGALSDLRPAVRRLRPAAQVAREAVRELDTAAPALGGTLTKLRAASPPLTKALPALRQTLCEVNPVIRYLKPYTDDVIMSLVGLGSASNSYDAIGHLIRLSPIIGENSAAGLPKEVTLAMHTLLRSGVFAESTGLSWNPYPEPGMIGKDAAGRGKTISGPDALRESGYVYPRVMADC